MFLLWGDREGIAEKTVTKEDQFYHHCGIIHSAISDSTPCLPGQHRFHYKTLAASQCFCYGVIERELQKKKTVTKENQFYHDCTIAYTVVK